jgi:hypothetical protein
MIQRLDHLAASKADGVASEPTAGLCLQLWLRGSAKLR